MDASVSQTSGFRAKCPQFDSRLCLLGEEPASGHHSPRLPLAEKKSKVLLITLDLKHPWKWPLNRSESTWQHIIVIVREWAFQRLIDYSFHDLSPWAMLAKGHGCCRSFRDPHAYYWNVNGQLQILDSVGWVHMHRIEALVCIQQAFACRLA